MKSKPTKRTVKAWAILLMLVMITGCSKPPMTNDEIIAETQKCLKAGMIAQPLSRTLNPAEIVKIQCEAKP